MWGAGKETCSQGCQVSGERAAASAQERGIETKVGILEEVHLGPDTFDFITMIDVLEHMSNPNLALSKISAALRSHGLLIALTGNASSFSARLWGPHWYYFYYPDHVNVFTDRSLLVSIERAGLQPLCVRCIRHPTSGLIREARRAKERLLAFRPGGTQASVRHVPMGLNTPTATRLFRWADHLLLFATKP
jgi:SAM-dependent methyltransferase